MLKYFIRLFLVLSVFKVAAQDAAAVANDSVIYQEKYGLRVGIDISRPILSSFIDDYQGFEVVGDYRLTERLFVAGEIGNEKKTQQEDLYNFTTSGSYIKLGVDLNTYTNWYGEQNFITFGGRYAFSTFSQTLNDYQVFQSDRYFSEADFQVVGTEPSEFSGLSASWLEMVLGFKTRVVNNFYVGISTRLAFLVTNKESDRFPNLWIPGFNKVTDGSNWGVGYNYTVSYFIPLYKKDRKQREPINEVVE